MYIEQKDRPYWDRFVNVFLDELFRNKPKQDKGTVPLSKAGLAYALSRIIWAIFNKYPSYTVGSDLCAVLDDVKMEFIRRKMWNQHEQNLIANGDLSEGEDFSGPETVSQPVNIQSLPKPPGKEISPGVFLTNIEDATKYFEQKAGADVASKIKAKIKPKTDPFKVEPQPNPYGAPPPAAPYPTVQDPDAESDAETKLLRSLKAYAIAQQSNGSPESMRKLQNLVTSNMDALLKFYKL